MDRIERFVISILVANHSGVLSRVSGMFTRRGFNIDTLTVGETESPEFSRITISTHCDRSVCDQIVKQLEKMYDVKTVKVMKRDLTVTRELLLIKINNVADKRQDIMSVVDVFRAKITDYSPEALVIEIRGESSKINAFIELLEPYGSSNPAPLFAFKGAAVRYAKIFGAENTHLRFSALYGGQLTSALCGAERKITPACITARRQTWCLCRKLMYGRIRKTLICRLLILPEAGNLRLPARRN